MNGPGLTSAEAARRLAQYGPNEPVRVRRLSALHQLIRLLATPLVAILLVAAFVSVLLGERADATIIVVIVALGAGLNFWQTYRSSRAVERLKASVTPTATVSRDGRWQEVSIRAVVPDAPHLVFLGTSVVSGTATAVARATAPSTLFGGIAERLAAAAPGTEFEHGLHRFSVLILQTTTLLVLFILLMSIALRRDALESLLFAVALGVGLSGRSARSSIS